MYLVCYAPETGLIQGLYTASAPQLLLAQARADAGMAFLVLESDLGSETLHTQWRVRAGQLERKALLTLIADPLLFQADGVDECLVSVEPLVPCVLRINEARYVLTQEQNLLVLCTTTPQTYRITLDLLPTHFAEPLLVEAI